MFNIHVGPIAGGWQRSSDFDVLLFPKGDGILFRDLRRLKTKLRIALMLDPNPAPTIIQVRRLNKHILDCHGRGMTYVTLERGLHRLSPYYPHATDWLVTPEQLARVPYGVSQ
jgi:hypothetical protein